MATYDLEEQEQLDELKTWWKMHGNLVTAVVTVVALAVLGWQGWNWWQRNQGAQASVLYSSLQSAAAQGDVKRVRALAGELIDKFAGTSYAGLGALLAGKVQADSGDGKSAQAQLAWAVDHAHDQSLRDLARLRLAALLLDDKAYDDALARLATEPVPAFAARFSELRGDVMTAQGKGDEARAAYEQAIAKAEAMGKDSGAEGRVQGMYVDMLKGKLDGLGVRK